MSEIERLALLFQYSRWRSGTPDILKEPLLLKRDMQRLHSPLRRGIEAIIRGGVGYTLLNTVSSQSARNPREEGAECVRVAGEAPGYEGLTAHGS